MHARGHTYSKSSADYDPITELTSFGTNALLAGAGSALFGAGTQATKSAGSALGNALYSGLEYAGGALFAPLAGAVLAGSLNE